jgi:membrane-bound lytic murein transglycosylase D
MASQNRFFVTLSLIFVLLGHASQAQDRYRARFENSGRQWLISSFNEYTTNLQTECPPNLAESIPLKSGLDAALDFLAEDRALEARCIDLYFGNDCANYYTIARLSDLYFPLFEEYLANAKLDRNYKYLPILASGLHAGYDDGANHAGLWGLDLPRARLTRLAVNRFVDERKAPEPATRAAVDLLSYYANRFPNDPLRVVVAMLQGVQAAEQFDSASLKKSDDLYQTLGLLRVTLRLFANTEHENQLVDWVNFYRQFETVTFADTLSYQACVDVLEVDREMAYGLNPAFHGNLIPPSNTDIAFILPKAAAEMYLCHPDSVHCYKPIDAATARANRADAARTPEGNVTYYTVRSGDVLGKIAERNGVRLSDLKAWNNLRSDHIRVGQKLIVYGGKTSVSEQAAASSTPNTNDVEYYTVKDGDSLWEIARGYPGVSPENIMEWNNIDANIRAGMKLKIYRK